ncbi:MAG: UbiA family prenyltransferase, partial [Candidatus Thermoplasmatota archaeon]
ERFGILTLFIWIVVLSSLRTWIEAKLLGYAYQEISFQYLFAQIHIACFFVAAYVGGVLILKYFSKQKLAKVANLSALGFIMVLIPPFLDLFTNPNPTPYTYGSPIVIGRFIVSFFTQSSVGPSESLFQGGTGIIFELAGILTATSLYVLLRTKSIVRTVFNAVCFFLLFILIGSPFLILLRGTAGQLIHPLFIVRYIVVSSVLLLLLLKVTKKGLLTSFLKSSRLLTTSHFALMSLIGIFVAGHLGQVGFAKFEIQNIVGDPTFWQIFTGNIGTFFLSIITIIFIWQYAVMINHVYDVRIDSVDNKKRLIPSGIMKSGQVKKISLVYAIIALVLGVSLGIWPFILVVLGLFFGTIYSVPPFRIRDRVVSTAILGAGSTIAFFLGYMTPGYVKMMHGEFAGRIMRTYPEMTMESIYIGIIIFVALTIGPLIKDYKDYKGDKKAGVRNIYTIYGLKKGVNITSMLLPIPFLCLLLLFHNPVDIVVLIAAGGLAGFSFKKFKDTRLVFAIYFPVIIYCLLRWFQIINL